MGMTLTELRSRFWWLGPGEPGSYIISLDGDLVTIKVAQTSWTRRNEAYEEAIARDFAALGLRIQWVPFWGPKLEEEMARSRKEAEDKGVAFDREAFIAQMQKAETRK